MTEVEYVLDKFDEHFSSMREKKILLHGSRNYAEAILKRYGMYYHFIGIMSMDPLEGSSWQGLPVFREEDLQNAGIDLVILTERVKYAEAAFRSIRRICRKNNIRIYNMYGLDEFQIHYEAETFKSPGKEEALQICGPYDVIAFEVMDVIFPATARQAEMIPIEMFSGLIRELRSRGKTIRFSLRKSFPEEEQIRALKAFGFLGEEAEELIHRTGEDLSFRSLKESAPGKKIVYFGQGLVNEFILPRCYGIDTVLFVGRTVLERLRPNRTVSEPSFFSHDLQERLLKEIQGHDVISFDVFDTLLLRKTLYPRDVYELTEQRARETGYLVEGFATARARVEDNTPCSTLDQIYEELADLYSWDQETEETLKSMELSVERMVLAPRAALVEVFQHALRQGKRVVLTSDMYLPEAVLRKILDEKGVRGYEKIFVSCDYSQEKQRGLYKQLLTMCGEPDHILHIGDDADADGKAANELGISSFIIPSSVSLAQIHGWLRSIETTSTLMERCLLGLTVSRLFADPFQSPNPWNLPIRERMVHIGNSIIGPLVTGHMCWLIRKLRAERYDNVLFFARDGWLPLKIYERIRERLSLPQGNYYYANRHSAFLCCADSEAQAEYFAEMDQPYRLDTEQLLKRVFMIPEAQILPRAREELNTEYIERHQPLIHEIAERARMGYLRYSEKLGLRKGDRIAAVDFIAAGSTQKFLSAALPYTFRGFYYGSWSDRNNETKQIEYYLSGNNPALLREYIDLESFFSSPEPAVNYMNEQGVPVFQEECRSRQLLRDLEAVWETAESFAQQFFDLFYQEGEEIAPALIEEMYAADPDLGINLPAFDDWYQMEIKKRPIGGTTEGEG